MNGGRFYRDNYGECKELDSIETTTASEAFVYPLTVGLLRKHTLQEYES